MLQSEIIFNNVTEKFIIFLYIILFYTLKPKKVAFSLRAFVRASM